MIKQNKLAVAVAAVLSSAAMSQAYAQQTPAGNVRESEQIEEVVISGLRESLEASMDIKRDAIGVVDAISAEDIGKFPDTNLAESLQRITGISIDRRNGEGAQVTARGFGPGFNSVTLNGRQMPSADAFGNGGIDTGGFGPQGRSFNFANLAAEAINGLEVYKTGRADIASGGIGATINVKTARPFDNQGMIVNFGAKGLYDESSPFDNEITPELSGIFSYANDDQTWGVGLSASYQERRSGGVESTVNDWTIREWSDAERPGGFSPTTVIENAPAEGQLFGIPNDVRYAFSDVERERINAQGVIQFAPMDTLTLTLDYTVARNEIVQNRGEQTMWLQQGGTFDRVIFDQTSGVRTPIYIHEMTAGFATDNGYSNKDFGFEQQRSVQTNELDSIGFNADWQVTDSFSLSFDYHSSEAKSLPDDPVTGGSQTAFSFAGVPNCADLNFIATTGGGPTGACAGYVAQEYDFSGDLPIATRWIYPNFASALARTGGNPQYAFNPNQLGSQILRIFYQRQDTEMDQARLDGTWSFDKGRIQFGAEARELEVRQRSSTNQMNMGNWGATDANSPVGLSMTGLVRPFSLVGLFDDFSPGAATVPAWRGDATALAQWAFGPGGYGDWNDGSGTPDGVLRYNTTMGNDDFVNEDVQAAYVQYGMQHDWGRFPINVLLGLRYEQTDVTSTSLVALPTAVVWEANNDFTVTRSQTISAVTEESDYDNLLPSFDFDIGLTDTLKARVSWSKTMARAPVGNLVAGAAPAAPTGSVLINPAARGGGNANNPALIPYESKNIDLSLEWYFSDSGYVSATYWNKDVDNFVGNSIMPMELYGLLDPTNGPDAIAARDFLQANGTSVSDTTLFVATALRRQGNLNAGSFATAMGGLAAFEAAVDLVGDASRGDPLYTFNVNRPVNQESARIYGWEFGGQYFFGDTGFGLQANYTIVEGDVDFDSTAPTSENQFALIGLSDTANLVLMYENYGFTARLAWNWRDEFLAFANQGGSRNPRFVEDYQQVDLSVGYDVNDNLSLALEAINLTGEDIRWFGRSERQTFRVEDQQPRYALGARYKF